MQKSISALKQLVGIDVELEPDWRLLLAELRDLHPDLETFVPSVATAAEAFCLALTAQLDEEGEWSNTFLETVGTRIKAFYGVSENRRTETLEYPRLLMGKPQVGLDDVSLSWDATRTGFVLTLPKSRIASLSELEAVHKGVLLGDCFSDKPKHEPTSSDRTLEDWDDVAVDRTTSRPSLVPGLSPVAPVRRVVDRLPDLALLTRPDELLREPPYHLSVYASHGTVELHGSHSPTLELIAAYLNKFVRSNRNLMNNVSP